MEKDKIKHLLGGIGVSTLVGIVFTPLIGLYTGIVAGALKEIIWDWLLKKGTTEFLDFFTTAFGSFIAFLMLRTFL
mgnify:CR=1 FL=1